MTIVRKQIIEKVREALDFSNIISLNFVGSFVKKIDFNDIDIVLVVKKLNEKNFNNYVNKLYNIKFNNQLLRKKKIFVNTTFGPLKYIQKNLLTFHLMIYDIEGHKKHVLISPFTCFDWERSNISFKKSLKEIFPVINLTIKDFENSRRGIKNYIKDLKENKLSYSKYLFSKNSYTLKKKFLNLDQRETRLYLNHVLYFTIINLFKYRKRKNILPNDKEYTQILKEFSKNIKYIRYEKNAINLKENVIKILNNIFDHNLSIIKDSTKINVLRHFQTKYDPKVFIGQKINPSIKLPTRKIINFSFSNGIIYLSESKRTFETLKCLCPKAIMKNIYIDGKINELDYGLAEGLKFSKFLKLFPSYIQYWKTGKIIKFPEGESYYNLAKRVDLFFGALKHKKNNILVITHNNVLRYILSKSLNTKLNEIYKFNIQYGLNILFILNSNNEIEILSDREIWQKNLLNL